MPLDVETLLLIGAAVVGIAVGVLHLWGYVPRRYRRMLSEVQASTAKAISDALEAQISRFVGDEGEDGPDPLGERLDALASKLEAFSPDAIGEAIASRLDLSKLPSAIGAEIAMVLNKAQEDAMKQLTAAEGIPAEITGAIGGTMASDNRRLKDLKSAIGEGAMGPYGGILQQFMPPLYDYLTENPDMVLKALEMPVVQNLIKRGASMLGHVTGSAMESAGGTGGWG